MLARFGQYSNVPVSMSVSDVGKDTFSRSVLLLKAYCSANFSMSTIIFKISLQRPFANLVNKYNTCWKNETSQSIQLKGGLSDTKHFSRK